MTERQDNLQKQTILRSIHKRMRKGLTIQEKMQVLISEAQTFTKFLINKNNHHQRKKHDQDYDQEEEDAMLSDQPSIIKGGRLKEYQLDALNWMKTLYGMKINGILADDMGLGKTIQTIALIGFLRQYKKINGPHIIIGPKITLGNWENQFRKWLPMVKVVKLIATRQQRQEILQEQISTRNFDVVITSFQGVRLAQRHLRKIDWCYLIIDQAHKIKNQQSILSQTVRSLKTRHKLLLTGTPLQNNLHQLWALMNFIFPELFDSSQIFDNWFQQQTDISSKEQLQKRNVQMIQKLHRILRPFMLRRTKAQVEKTLPPKKQIHLYVGLSKMQHEIYKSLIQNRAIGEDEDKKFYLNLIMQLRKACNHPYLFPEKEDPDLPCPGEHLVYNSGKMIVLDKLLHKLKRGNHQVLLFSQMTMVLNILQEYCNLRNFNYCRIDGSTDMDVRDYNIAEFTRQGSDVFIFLLSTRAGGLGINLATADTVIIYDSDWNPQMDLQAMDRAHRIGQKNMVNVYRLITQNTVEQKIIQRQTIKLKWDSLVIQQGRIANQHNRQLSKDEMRDMMQFGASVIFKSANGTVTQQDIDQLLMRGQQKTNYLNKQVQSQFKKTNNQLDLRFTAINIFERRDQDNQVLDHLMAQRINDLRTRRDKRQIQIDPRNLNQKKKKALVPQHQFYQNRTRLQQLLLKQYESKQNNGAPLSTQQQEEKEALFKTGFSSWSKTDFNTFVHGCQKFGKDSLLQIKDHIGTKTMEEVQQYSRVFWDRIHTISQQQKIIKQIQAGQQKIKNKLYHQSLLDFKIKQSPHVEFNSQVYTKFRSKLYSQQADKFLVKHLQSYGVSGMTRVITELSKQSIFMFDHYLRSRTQSELNRRMQSLYKLIEKQKQFFSEEQLPKKKQKQGKKEKLKQKDRGEVISVQSEGESVQEVRRSVLVGEGPTKRMRTDIS